MADTPQQPADPAPATVSESATAPVEADAPTLVGAELNAALRVQVEYYFSKQNLPKDTYLLSQMDEDHYVPIQLIAGFSKVKELSEDIEVIANSVEESLVCELDETRTKIKPNSKAVPRHTVILRDTPTSTTQEDVEALWKTSSFEGIEEIRPDIAGYWFVTFASEDVARDAVMWVRQQELGGEKVKARLKTESVAPSVFYAPPAPVYAAPVAYAMGGWNPDLRYQYQWDGQDANSNGRGGEKDRRRFQRRAKGQQQGQQGQQGNDGRRNKRARKQGQQAPQAGAKKAEEFKLGANNFPPLPQKQGGSGGYTGNYQRYNKKDFISVIKGAQATRPDLPDVPVVEQEAHHELASDVAEKNEPVQQTEATAEAEAPSVAGVPAEKAASETEAPGDAPADGPVATPADAPAAASDAAPDVELPVASSGASEASAGPAQTWAQKLAASKSK